MSVDTPTLLAVLAHEIRGPVSVIQGYLRLLAQQQPASGTDGRMLDAMRKSTTRLADLGRDASDLSAWLGATDRPVPAAVTVSDLIADLCEQTPLAIAAAAPPQPNAHGVIESRDRGMLCRALGALVVSVSRDHDDAPCPIDISADDRRIVVHIRPAITGQPAADSSPPGLAARQARANAPPSFNRGGMGLELVLASHVLESHGARVSTSANGGLDVYLPRKEARR
jgi:hypothetical protein